MLYNEVVVLHNNFIVEHVFKCPVKTLYAISPYKQESLQKQDHMPEV